MAIATITPICTCHGSFERLRLATLASSCALAAGRRRRHGLDAGHLERAADGECDQLGTLVLGISFGFDDLYRPDEIARRLEVADEIRQRSQRQALTLH